jgi:hypothetical protein
MELLWLYRPAQTGVIIFGRWSGRRRLPRVNHGAHAEIDLF